jgi:hypothetical protein
MHFKRKEREGGKGEKRVALIRMPPKMILLLGPRPILRIGFVFNNSMRYSAVLQGEGNQRRVGPGEDIAEGGVDVEALRGLLATHGISPT